MCVTGNVVAVLGILLCSLQVSTGTNLCRQQENDDTVLSLCEIGSMTGSRLHLDTTNVPTHEAVECRCNLTYNALMVVIDYNTNEQDQECGNTLLLVGETEQRIYGCSDGTDGGDHSFDPPTSLLFTKNTTEKNTPVCVSLLIDDLPGLTNKGNATLTCFTKHILRTASSGSSTTSTSSTTTPTTSTSSTSTTTTTTTTPTTPTTSTTTTPSSTTTTSTTTITTTTPTSSSTTDKTTTTQSTTSTTADEESTTTTTPSTTTTTTTAGETDTTGSTTTTSTTGTPVAAASTNVGGIAGGVVAAVVVIVIIVIIIVCCCLRRRRREKKKEHIVIPIDGLGDPFNPSDGAVMMSNVMYNVEVGNLDDSSKNRKPSVPYATVDKVNNNRTSTSSGPSPDDFDAWFPVNGPASPTKSVDSSEMRPYSNAAYIPDDETDKANPYARPDDDRHYSNADVFPPDDKDDGYANLVDPQSPHPVYDTPRSISTDGYEVPRKSTSSARSGDYQSEPSSPKDGEDSTYAVIQ